MDSVVQNPSVQQLQRENARLRAELVQARKERDEAKEVAADLASEQYWITEWVANPSIRDREKVGGIGYFLYYKSTKPRPDGTRYYSREQIAERLGNVRTAPDKQGTKEQVCSDVHTRFKKSGLIVSTPEPQKHNKSLPNYFDKVSPQWENNPRGVVLEYGSKAENYGGKRVALHRGCGGRCLEHTSYICTKCGEAGIPENNVMMVAEEKWQRWQEEDAPEVTPPVDEPDIEEDEEDEAILARPDNIIDLPQIKLESPTEITDKDKDAFYWRKKTGGKGGE